MSRFEPGQTVTGVDLHGQSVTGQVIRVRPSVIDPSIQIVDVDVDGYEFCLSSEECTLTPPAPKEAEPMTTATDQPAKKPRASKKTAEAAEEAPPVDFKALAAETRKKFQERGAAPSKLK